jgi:hypothetical protein
MRPTIDRNVVVANGQFPVAVLIDRPFGSKGGWRTSDKERYQSGEDPLGHRREYIISSAWLYFFDRGTWSHFGESMFQ